MARGSLIASWLIPVRDGVRWLGRAVGSALADSGPEDEIWVIDDGSTDDPGSVLPRDPRIRLLRQGPLGIARALEHGRQAASGAFLVRLDADDVSLPGRMGRQRAALLADPGLGVVGGQARMVREDGPVPEGMARYLAWVNGLRDLRAALLIESPLFHPATMLRAEAVAAVGGWRQGDLPEDYDLWLRLAGAGFGLAAVDQPVVQLLDRPDRLTRTDPRYRRSAFRGLKIAWARAHLAGPGTRVVVWGAGREGRPWIRAMRAAGAALPFVVDLRAGGQRQGVPIRTAEALVGAELDLLLVAVGARGARDLIRKRLHALRPDLQEGVHWWAVA